MTEENLIKGSDLFNAIRDLKNLILKIESDDYSFIRSMGLRSSDFDDMNSMIEEGILNILNVKLIELEDQFKEL